MLTRAPTSAGQGVTLGGTLNRSHPLNFGLVARWLALPGRTSGPRAYDLAGSNHGTLAGGAAWVTTTRAGASGAIACTATTDEVDLGPNSTLFPSPTDASVLLWHRKRDATLRPSAAFGLAGTADGPHRVGCHLPYSDGTAYFDWGGFAAGNRVSVAGLAWDTGWHRWAFTVGGGLGQRIYRDGVLVASNANTPTRTLTTDGFALNHGNGGDGDLADFDDVTLYLRAVSPAEVAADYDLSRRGYPGVLNRSGVAAPAMASDVGSAFRPHFLTAQPAIGSGVY